MKIERKPDQSDLTAYHLAQANNFALTPMLSASDGKVSGWIPKEFLNSGLLGRARETSFMMGISRVRDEYSLCGDTLTDAVVEAFLREKLVNVAGLKAIEYARHAGDEGEVIVATLIWDDVGETIRTIVGSNYLSREWNFVGGNTTEMALQNLSDFSGASLDEFLARRRELNPNAAELRFSRNDLPKLLGFKGRERDAAIAAFGHNGGVCSAIYASPLDETHFPVPGDTRFIHGDQGERLSSPQSISAGTEPKSAAARPAKGHLYALGGDIFSIIRNLRDHVCGAPNILAGRQKDFPQFDPDVFAELMRELCVNAFVHGRWGTYLFGREDNERMVGPRLAIVHLGDRIEVVNSLGTEGHAHPRNHWVTSLRRSPLHNALVDVGLAHGRMIGVKLVRHHATRMGLPAPLFVRGQDTHRAILPLSLEAPGWCVAPDQKTGQTHDPLTLYALHLAKCLGRLDEYVLASALYVRPKDARSTLNTLVDRGGLRREKAGSHILNGFSAHLTPSYIVEDPSAVSSLIEEFSQRLAFYPAPPGISLGGQYQLSCRSTPYLNEKDLRAYLRGLYEFELLASREIDEAVSIHMETLRAYPTFDSGLRRA